MNTSITRQSVFHSLQEATNTPHKAQSQSASWGGYGITSVESARGWLLMAPLGDREKSHFQKITASEKNVIYLTGNKESPDDKHYIEPVDKLPEYILNDTILDCYSWCNAGDTVSDIITEYSKTSGYGVFLGKVDIPCVYEFALPQRRYFHFAPAFPRLESELTKGHTEHIAFFTSYDFFWETNTWNAFTTGHRYLISLMLPNYEISSKKQFSYTLTELMSLPPDPDKFFPGGSIYRESADRFHSYQTKETSGFAFSGDKLKREAENY